MNEGENRLTEMPDRTPTEGTFELTIRCNLFSVVLLDVFVFLEREREHFEFDISSGEFCHTWPGRSQKQVH